jgi:tetratricopeptide (TPR) repeat protein
VAASPDGEPVGTFLGIAVPRTSAIPRGAVISSSHEATATPAAGVPVVPSNRSATPPPRRRWRRLALVATAVIIAGAATVAFVELRGRSSAPSVPATAGARPDPAQDTITRANELVAQGDREAALELLNRARRQAPDSAGLAYATGRVYFSKFYWTEGLRNFRDAIRSDPSYRSDPELIKTVLRGFLTTPSYNDDLASFLREDIGSAVQPMLEETVRDHPNAAIRTRAATELRRYH